MRLIMELILRMPKTLSNIKSGGLVGDFEPMTIFSTLGVWQGSEYASVFYIF